METTNFKLDEYKIIKSLSEKKSENIWLASEDNNKKLYVIKQYKSEDFDENEFFDYKMSDEVKLLSSLYHPNIVKIKECKMVENKCFVIAEYINGGTLAKALENYYKKFEKSFSEEIVQYLMKQIIEASDYLHGKRMLLGNIKLENILLNYDNEDDKNNLDIMKAKVKILLDITYAIKNNLHFLNYETGFKACLDDDELLDYKQKKYFDVLSVGMIGYNMIMGQNVFNVKDMDELITKIKEGKCIIPKILSKEFVSFINSAVRDGRPFGGLINHTFLIEDVKNFHKINLILVNKEAKNSNSKNENELKNKIWSVYKDECEKILINIH